MHITSHQFLDLTKLYEPITKRTKMIVRPDTVTEVVRLAFKYGESEKPGAAGIIFQADNPVILAGCGAVRADASRAITHFSTKMKIPVITTMMAKGVIPFDHPYAMWTIGIPQKDYQNKLIEKAGLVIAAGYDLVEYAPQKWNPEGRQKIVHIDARPTHINKLYQPVVEVVGDISDSLERISKRTSSFL